MNILPHKSWHVRTKKNIARVKKDQAQAAEEEKEKQRRIALAAQEARTSFLRNRVGHRLVGSGISSAISVAPKSAPEPEIQTDVEIESGAEPPTLSEPFALSEVADLTQSDGHINFFQEIEDGKRLESGVNVDHENEKKAEQEDYEKKIGLLVYLGQNSLEHSKDRPWYENVDRKSRKGKYSEVESEPAVMEKDIKIAKLKDFQDPLKDIRMYLSSPSVKKKLDSLPIASKSLASAVKRKAELVVDEDFNKVKNKKTKKSKKSRKDRHRSHHKSKSKKHHKKHKATSESGVTEDEDDDEKAKCKNLEKLRVERLQREREERRKAEKLLATLRGDPPPELELEANTSTYIGDSGRRQKYNSQFNPHLARQNYDN